MKHTTLALILLASSALAQPVQPDPNGNCYHALSKDGHLTEQERRDGHYLPWSRGYRMCEDKNK